MSAPFWKAVQCHGYLKPAHDGRIIEILKDGSGQEIGARYWGDGEDVPDDCECDGALEFLKTYFKLEIAEFTGVLVGKRKVVMSAWLYADTNQHYNGREYIYCGKQAKDVEDCAIVYFRLGQKRLVPLSMLEDLPDERSDRNEK